MPKTVYVVDDDALACEVICGRLRAAGYEVEGYGEPAAFLATAASMTDGCIILDLEMPGMDGLQVQKRLAELGSQLPVIFYSSKAGVRQAVDGMRAGAVDFLQKSSELGPLLKAVEKLIGKPKVAK